MGKSGDDHVLIDTYLRKSIWSRMGAWLIRLLILAVVLAVAAFIAWRMLSPPKQYELRQKWALLDETATILEEKGILPVFSKTQITGESGTPAMANKLNPRKRSEVGTSDPNSEEIEIDDGGVVDLRSKALMRLAEKGPNAMDLENERRVALAKLQVLAELKHNPAFKLFEANQGERLKTMPFDEVRAEVVALEREMREKETMAFLEHGGLSVSWKVWDTSDPVTWTDFQNQNIDEEISRWGAYIATQLVITSNGESWVAFAVMARQNSWVRPGNRTEKTLRHERLHFDITELFARKFRIRAASEPASDMVKIIAETQKELKATQTAYDNDAYASLGNQKRWEEKIAEALKNTANFAWVPKPKRIAKARHPQGVFLFAQIYDHGGPGFEPSMRLAKKWYEIGVQSSHTDAMNNLGALYLKGIAGKSPNPRRAFKLFLRAAKRGNPNAEFNVGVMYWRGIGTKPDRSKAMDFFTEAADDIPYARKALKILEHL